VKRNAVAGRAFDSFAALEAHLAAWVRDIADARVHGTTGEVPRERFAREEAARLKPVAGVPPFLAARDLVRRVSSDCAVEVDGNAYSVPWRLIGERVSVTVADGTVRVSHAGCEVARHPVRAGRHGRVVDPAHFAGVAGASGGIRAAGPGAAAGTGAVPVDPALLRPLAEYEAVAGGAW